MSEQATSGAYVSPTGEFTRDQRYIATRITEDGRDGYPVAPGRYRLIVSRACPWANRAIIVRRLLGLEDVISMGVASPTHDNRSWSFDLDPGGRDPVLGIERLQEAYFARFPGYDRGITVPAIVDVPTGQVVTNDYAQITLDLSTQWREYHRPGAPDLYPDDRREEIAAVNRLVFADVNNGVYRCGFAGTQEAYDKAYRRLFERLDWLSERLERQRYLVGNTITEADVRLFTTLARFDAVYHGHFKCNRSKLTEMPVLWAYARDCSRPAASATPSTSTTSSGTTTACTRTSTRPASSPTGPTSWAGSPSTAATRSEGTRSVPAPRRHPRCQRRQFRSNTLRSPRDPVAAERSTPCSHESSP